MRKISLLFLMALLPSAETSSFAAEPVGNLYMSASVGNNTTVSLVPASSNVGGLQLRTGVFTASASTTMTLFEVMSDGTLRPIYQMNSGAGTIGGNLPYPLSFPAGVGISAGASGSGSGGVGISYDLLGH